jgi:hypothetical protein
VFSEEPRFVDSSAMTANQKADGSQAFRIRLVDGVNRDLPAFSRGQPHTQNTIFRSL